MLFRRTKTIIIIGVSRFGAGLAGMLSGKGYRVVVVDITEESFRKLPETFGGYEIVGDGTDIELLKKAGIEDAEIVVAATDDDNINILVAQIASRIYQTEKVFARLNDKNKEEIIKGFNIKTICPYVLSVNEFARLSDEGYQYQEVGAL